MVINGIIHLQENADTEETSYFVLNVSNESCLSDGFCYIKKLLLQDQN